MWHAKARPPAAFLRVVRVGKINGRGGQEFRLACCLATSTVAAWSKRHGWSANLVARLDSLVRGGLKLRGKRATQRALERTLAAARAMLRNAPARPPAAVAAPTAAPAPVVHPANDMHAAATEHRLPHAHERCYVPHDLWPQEASTSTPHGAGWLGTVVAATEHGVRFRCDGEADAVSLMPRVFTERCAVIVSSDPSLWGLLDRDMLHCVFACCDLPTLLAFEATHRAALLTVRACWRSEWGHTELPGVTHDALCLAVEGNVVVVGGGRYDARSRAGGHLRLEQEAECLLRVGDSAFRIDTSYPVRAVAVHAATARVAIAHRRVDVMHAGAGAPRVLETLPVSTAVLAWHGGRLLVAVAGTVFSLVGAQAQPTLECKRSGSVTALAAAGGLLVVGYHNGVVLRKRDRSILHLRDACGANTRAVAMRGRTVTAARARIVDVWLGAQLIATLPCTGQVSALYLGPDHCIWVGAGAGGLIELWDDPRRGKRRVGMLRGHGGAVTGIGMDAEGRIVSSSLAARAGQRALWRSHAVVSAWA